LTDKISVLTDTDKAVIETLTMRMHTQEALSYLKDCGIQMVERTYYRYKNKVESMKWLRLEHIANRFTAQHLERTDRLELIESLMWKNYHAEKSPRKKVDILNSIVRTQLIVAAYYDATRAVMNRRLKSKTDYVLVQNEEKEQEQPTEMSFTADETADIRRLTLERF
jgi:hypothetical protein